MQLFAQNENIDSVIIKADSIFLISHKVSKEYQGVSDDKSEKAPTLLLYDDINPNILISKILFTDKKYLSDLLHVKDGIYKHVSATCDYPQNSILIYTNGKLSYIDICFQCQRIHTSEDLKNIVVFDQKRFRKVEALFKSNNLIIDNN